ncbi:MAG: helix-turn-helix protein [Candidatus Omnitrophica bacterium ADurb.Bin314]|jgi:transcriptional regulator with XRE-family HTH domain|nr:MAG: helix-turn-helix protein [Candidatus Omnitrophica bacterium ADurb.Bin314]HOE68852.1 helix-turn-helix domain-containing protein [Candidatus Omnitrophota bacterium]
MKRKNPQTKTGGRSGEPRRTGINLGRSVLELRKERGLSGVELCRRSNGLDPRTLTAVEKGRIRNPSIATLEMIAKGLGVAVSGIFRRAEVSLPECFSQGTPKGLYRIAFPSKGVEFIAFSPSIDELFCGKVLVDPGKSFDGSILNGTGAVFLQTLSGRFEGKVDGRGVTLKEGDNLFFSGGMDVSFGNPLQRQGALLLVSAPSCFSGRRFTAARNPCDL